MSWYYIDFETRSELDVRSVGSYKYATHPSTEVLCMGYLELHQDIPAIYRSGDPYPLSSKPELIVAHNADFEYNIWHHVMSTHGWPAVPIERWFCTAALAASFGFPRSLEGAANALQLPLQKDKTGKRMMLQITRPRRPWIKSRVGPKYLESADKLSALEKYCAIDVLLTRSIHRCLLRNLS